jgi:hypothetical protein
MVALVLIQPKLLGAGETIAVICGGAFDIFRVTEVDAVFPARSVTVRLITCPAPAEVTMLDNGQLATPDRESVQANVTVTSVLFHPFPFGTGDSVAVIVGAVSSKLTVATALAEFPAASVTLPMIF